MGVMHTILGFSFATTLMIANATSVAWLLCYYLLLKPAVSTLRLNFHHRSLKWLRLELAAP